MAGIRSRSKNTACRDYIFLAAEDNEINAEILQEILLSEGANCRNLRKWSDSTRTLLRHLKKGEFDAILMDVQMPVMNGYDATRAIRALPRKDAGKIPIIAMTANAFAEDEKRCIKCWNECSYSKTD